MLSRMPEQRPHARSVPLMPGERQSVAEDELLVRMHAMQLAVLAVPPAEGIGDIIVTAPAAEEHQRHQPAADQQ